MTSIHKSIMDYVASILTASLITNVSAGDTSKAGVVIQGPLQGEPMDPDEARISVSIFENDPDAAYGKAGGYSMDGEWLDEVVETEIGGSVTWARRFTIKCFILLVDSGEVLARAQEIARIVRSRIESSLLSAQWNVAYGNEAVVRSPIATSIKGEMAQGGGPPDAYTYYVKIRFDVLTQRGV